MQNKNDIRRIVLQYMNELFHAFRQTVSHNQFRVHRNPVCPVGVLPCGNSSGKLHQVISVGTVKRNPPGTVSDHPVDYPVGFLVVIHRNIGKFL